MPPAFHDEYSYLFQAKTFLAGRLYFEAHSLGEFFDQMHVLNDQGKFASRYFPGVGLWLAPWLAAGAPYLGYFVTAGLVAVAVFWIGRELGQSIPAPAAHPSRAPHRARTVGVIAALACMLSPAMLLFSNLLVSHHPTTLGLVTFTLCYLRALRSGSIGWPLAGGLALALAMLCRPLTAFGFSLPFGIHLLWLLAKRQLPRALPRMAAALAPVAIALALLAGYNTAITGRPWQSPYGLYTEIYTPKHAYGFHNVSRALRAPGPKVLKHYDDWAEEHTAARGLELLGRRIDASAFWSVGRIVLAFLAPAFLALLPRMPAAWRLLAAAAAGVHAVYFPYGFEGIFNLSYVFETVPILCLLAAATGVALVSGCSDTNRRARRVWLVLFAACGLAGPLHGLLRPGPDGGIAQVRFARRYYAEFNTLLNASGVQPPALVFVRSEPPDRHLDLVHNSPTLDDPILRVRDRGARNVELMKMYPQREAWLFDAASGRLEPLRGRASPK